MRKKLIVFSIFVLFCAFNMFHINLPFGLRVNVTKSLPYSILWSVKGKPDNIEKGMIIAFTHSMSNMFLAKEITGVPGDIITVNNCHVFINGVDNGEILKETSKGDILTPIKGGIIETGFYFVHGKNKRSFDSRYEEFGLIHINSIQERLWAIF